MFIVISSFSISSILVNRKIDPIINKTSHSLPKSLNEVISANGFDFTIRGSASITNKDKDHHFAPFNC